jgi:Histone deacetylase domain
MHILLFFFLLYYFFFLEGNGIENTFYDDPSVMYISLHRYEHGTFYPGTGHATRLGNREGLGYNINIPWSDLPNGAGPGDAEYAAAFEEIVMPIATSFAPELVLVSAGFDAARGDPLGGCDITPRGYAMMTSRLRELAGGRMVVVLEGGYNLLALAQSVEAVVRILYGEQLPPPFSPKKVHECYHSTVNSLRTQPTSDVRSSSNCPRSNYGVLSVDDIAREEEEYEGLDRLDILRAQAPAAPALAALIEMQRLLAPHWPCMKARIQTRSAMANMWEAKKAYQENIGTEEDTVKTDDYDEYIDDKDKEKMDSTQDEKVEQDQDVDMEEEEEEENDEDDIPFLDSMHHPWHVPGVPMQLPSIYSHLKSRDTSEFDDEDADDNNNDDDDDGDDNNEDEQDTEHEDQKQEENIKDKKNDENDVDIESKNPPPKRPRAIS